MAITFVKSPLINVGDLLKSSDIAKQSEAMNSRLRSGLAEPWRIVFLYASLFRQIRNSDGLLSFPANLEFFKSYQHLDPAKASWPEAEAGDPAGVNVTNSLGSLIYGVDAPNIPSEFEVLDGVPLTVPGTISLPETPLEHWTLGKYQRGAVDASLGASAAPMLDVADQFWRLYQGPTSPHGNAYGGYMAGPQYGAYCGTFLGNPVQGLNHILTNTKTGAVTTFNATCAVYGSSAEESGSNVNYIGETESTIYVVKIDGSVQVFDRQDWMQGPYTDEVRLRKTAAKMIDRVFAMFASEHRGSDSQRKINGGSLENAFDFQSFFTKQYQLAPARGQATGGIIAPTYPVFTIGLVTANPAVPPIQIGSYRAADGFVIASGLITITAASIGAVQVFEFEITKDNVVVESFSIETDIEGVGSSIFVVSNPIGTDSVFGINLASATVAGGDEIRVEIAELADRKPRIFDAYALLRLAGAKISGSLDGGGQSESDSTGIYARHQQNCNVTNAYGLSAVPDAPAYINQSAVFETARQLSKNVRIIPRQQLLGYEVKDGKSILYFKRFAYGSSLMDAFDGIAPTEEEIAKNVQANGIRAKAPAKGWSNEWLMGVDFKVSSAFSNNTSIWRPEVYADYWSLNNRCIFHAQELGNVTNQRIRTHVAYGLTTANGNTLAEAPSSFNYAKKDSGNLNEKDCLGDAACEANRLKFYKSCRIYEPWPEIESVVKNGTDEVKVTFKTRLRSTVGEVNGATSGNIPRILNAGDLTALAAEPFRTDENGIREYLFSQGAVNNVTHNCNMTQAGNKAINQTGVGLGGVYGSCYPDFLFVKLIEKPYTDEPFDNNDQDSEDTPVDFLRETQKEIYLRAICEGFVDGGTTATINCLGGATGGLYAYTYETLNYEAHGKAWPTLLNSVDRPDSPRGFWPMPNTIMRAERFNQFSAAINLLTKVPLMMPMVVQYRTTVRNGSKDVDGIGWPSTSTDVCAFPMTSADTRALMPSIGGLSLIDDTPSGWSNWSSAQSLSATASLFEGSCGTTGTNWKQVNSSIRLEIDIQPTSEQKNALPPDLRALVDELKVSTVAKIFKNEVAQKANVVSVLGNSEECGTSNFFKNGTGFDFVNEGPEETFCGVFNGSYDPLDYYSPRGASFIQGDGGASGACAAGWQANLNIELLGGTSDNFVEIVPT